MATLHTINQSPSHSDAWQKMLCLANEGDRIILIEDACYACTQDKTIQELNRLAEQHSIDIYVLEPDHTARGLCNPTQWPQIDYNGFVSLVVETDKTINWVL